MLGGRRRARPDSVHTAWRSAGFRGYADHMETEEFRRALGELVETAARERCAIMCAEAVPWRCHRSLVADALVARGVEVRHIVGEGEAKPHVMPPFARVEGERIVYDALPQVPRES